MLGICLQNRFDFGIIDGYFHSVKYFLPNCSRQAEMATNIIHYFKISYSVKLIIELFLLDYIGKNYY